VHSGTFRELDGKVRRVAIKMQKEVKHRPAHLKCLEDDFVCEGKIQAGLSHPNVLEQASRVGRWVGGWVGGCPIDGVATPCHLVHGLDPL
jgi:hypothetical protein